MSLKRELEKRSGKKCELSGTEENLVVFAVEPKTANELDCHIYISETCAEQLNDDDKIDVNHWRCLNDSMWSEHRPVKAVVWRMLNKLKSEGWPVDLLEMMYLDEEDMEYAKAGYDDNENKLTHRDVNGVILQPGDSVVLIKDLKVKGSSMVAKQGTAVRRISLDPDNENYIEGKVDGQTIVIITEYVKKI